MPRVAQFGIAVGALGIMLMLMGLFPGVTGISPTIGIGIMQIFTILTGLGLLLIGALIYVKFTFYAFQDSTLMQQIGARLALTGYILSIMAGLSDLLGFGSHAPTANSDILIGPWQAAAFIAGFTIAAIGVLVYAMTGDS